MQMPDPRKNSQIVGQNSFGLAGNILLASILFGFQSPYWLFLAIPMVLISFTAESKLRK